MRETGRSPELSEGYRLDLSGDPDVPAPRRPDGTVVARWWRGGGAVVARFAARGLRRQAVEREALNDLLGASLGEGASTYGTYGAYSPGRTD